MQILYSKYNAIHKTLQKALYKSYSYNANVFAVNELPKQLQVNKELHCTGGKCCATEMNSYINNKGTEKKKRHDYYLLCWILWQVDIFFKYLAFVQSQLHLVNRAIHLQPCSELACPLTLATPLPTLCHVLEWKAWTWSNLRVFVQFCYQKADRFILLQILLHAILFSRLMNTENEVVWLLVL